MKSIFDFPPFGGFTNLYRKNPQPFGPLPLGYAVPMNKTAASRWGLELVPKATQELLRLLQKSKPKIDTDILDRFRLARGDWNKVLPAERKFWDAFGEGKLQHIHKGLDPTIEREAILRVLGGRSKSLEEGLSDVAKNQYVRSTIKHRTVGDIEPAAARPLTENAAEQQVVHRGLSGGDWGAGKGRVEWVDNGNLWHSGNPDMDVSWGANEMIAAGYSAPFKGQYLIPPMSKLLPRGVNPSALDQRFMVTAKIPDIDARLPAASSGTGYVRPDQPALELLMDKLSYNRILAANAKKGIGYKIPDDKLLTPQDRIDARRWYQPQIYNVSTRIDGQPPWLASIHSPPDHGINYAGQPGSWANDYGTLWGPNFGQSYQKGFGVPWPEFQNAMQLIFSNKLALRNNLHYQMLGKGTGIRVDNVSKILPNHFTEEQLIGNPAAQKGLQWMEKFKGRSANDKAAPTAGVQQLEILEPTGHHVGRVMNWVNKYGPPNSASSPTKNVFNEYAGQPQHILDNDKVTRLRAKRQKRLARRPTMKNLGELANK